MSEDSHDNEDIVKNKTLSDKTEPPSVDQHTISKRLNTPKRLDSVRTSLNHKFMRILSHFENPFYSFSNRNLFSQADCRSEDYSMHPLFPNLRRLVRSIPYHPYNMVVANSVFANWIDKILHRFSYPMVYVGGYEHVEVYITAIKESSLLILGVSLKDEWVQEWSFTVDPSVEEIVAMRERIYEIMGLDEDDAIEILKYSDDLACRRRMDNLQYQADVRSGKLRRQEKEKRKRDKMLAAGILPPKPSKRKWIQPWDGMPWMPKDTSKKGRLKSKETYVDTALVGLPADTEIPLEYMIDVSLGLVETDEPEFSSEHDNPDEKK